MNKQNESTQFLVSFLALSLFGLVYNWLVGLLNRHGWGEGKSALLVVVGTAVTLALSIPLIGIRAIAIVAGGFIASGTPMIIGDLYRKEVKDRTFLNMVKGWGDGV